MLLEKKLVPEEWTIGVIKPLYKGKGDINCVDSYRGITLLSCLGKLFTLIINERLKKKIYPLLGEEQAGFRNGYCTIDHVFTFDFIANYYINKGKRLYVAFIDYRKAFDTVNRNVLWNKLIKYGISGLMLQVISRLYNNAKSCVSYENCISEFFICSTGVRQGENLSPLLFSIFLNDLVPKLSEHIEGLTLLSEEVKNCINNESVISFNIHTLLYADDTILMADSPTQLQAALDTMSVYCNDNKLSVNTEKNKSNGIVKRKSETTTSI